MRIEVKATESNNISYEVFLKMLSDVGVISRWNAISYFIGFLGCIDDDMYYYIEKAYSEGILKS